MRGSAANYNSVWPTKHVSLVFTAASVNVWKRGTLHVRCVVPPTEREAKMTWPLACIPVTMERSVVSTNRPQIRSCNTPQGNARKSWKYTFTWWEKNWNHKSLYLYISDLEWRKCWAPYVGLSKTSSCFPFVISAWFVEVMPKKTGRLLHQKDDAILYFFLCAPVPTGPLFISFCPCSVQAIKKTLKCTAISINPNFNVTDTAKLYLPQELFHICHGGSFYIELIQGGGQHLSKNIDCK